tara:strand:+ start:727 stop:963 length:237 start_codon:yes stop_codon:yes gene_type:complete
MEIPNRKLLIQEIEIMIEHYNWEHEWYKISYDKGVLQQQGIKGDKNYEGLARYCKCPKCRPDNYCNLESQFNHKFKIN